MIAINKPVTMTEFLELLFLFWLFGNISARSLIPEAGLNRSTRETMQCPSPISMCLLGDLFVRNLPLNQTIKVVVNEMLRRCQDGVIGCEHSEEVTRIIFPEAFSRDQDVRIIIGDFCVNFPGSPEGCKNNLPIDFECEWQKSKCVQRNEMKNPQPRSPDVNVTSVSIEGATTDKRPCYPQSSSCVIRDLYMLNSSSSQDIQFLQEGNKMTCRNGIFRCEQAGEYTKIILPQGFQKDLMIVIGTTCMNFPASNENGCNTTVTVDFECNVNTGHCSPRTDLIITPTTESFTTSHHNDPASDRITAERAVFAAFKIGVPVVAVPLSLATAAAFFYNKIKNP